MKTKFFCSYHFKCSKTKQQGFGHITLVYNECEISQKLILEAMEYLEKNEDVIGDIFVILNLIKLKDEE